MKAYKHLIKHAIATGHNVTVWDGEENQVLHGTAYKAIIDAIESVDMAEVLIYDAAKKRVGWAQIISSLDDDETVADYTCTPFMDAWDDLHMLTLI
jgi:hypothetical protein